MLASLENASANFQPLDWFVLILYLLAMVGIGVYFSRREKTTEQFFLAGRRIPWWAAGLSIFGTQLSAITFMAIPATAFNEDWSRIVGNFMIMPAILVVLFVFLPFFRRLELSTAYEYLEKRFHVSIRQAASLLFILLQLGRMGIVLYLPAIALSAVTGMNVYLCIALMGVLATLYTVLGGIEAVIWTDVVQVIVLLGGALLCIGTAISLTPDFQTSAANAFSVGKFRALNWSWDPAQFTVWVVVLGGFFTSLIPYSTDQTVVQRYLTTRNEKQAANSLWMNLFMTIPAALIFYGLGSALFMFYSTHPQLAQPDKVDQIVPWFVVSQLPAGIAGLVIAGIFAASMSSLDSSMNSVATAYITDFHRRFRPSGSDEQNLKLAKYITILLGLIGTGIAAAMASVEIKYLFDFFNQIVGLFGGGLLGVFLLAALTRRATTVGVFAGLIVGTLVNCYLAFQTDVVSYVFGLSGCLSSVVTGYLVSLCTRKPGKEISSLNVWG